MNDAVATYLDHFQSLGLDGSSCSPSDIERLQSTMGVQLPAAYKAYLRIAGNEPPSARIALSDIFPTCGLAANACYENVVSLRCQLTHSYSSCTKAISSSILLQTVAQTIHLCSTILRVNPKSSESLTTSRNLSRSSLVMRIAANQSLHPDRRNV